MNNLEVAKSVEFRDLKSARFIKIKKCPILRTLKERNFENSKRVQRAQFRNFKNIRKYTPFLATFNGENQLKITAKICHFLPIAEVKNTQIFDVFFSGLWRIWR